MGGKKRKLNQQNQSQAKRFQKGGGPRSSSQQQQQKQPQKKGSGGGSGGPNPEHRQKQHELPTIPFNPSDRILLIGEGDLSFAASLAIHHRCTNLVATVLEKSAAEVTEKYPQAAANITSITTPPPRPPRAASTNDDDEDGHNPSELEDEDDEDEEDETTASTQPIIKNKIVYNIDVTKPFPASIARNPPPSRILFNFPHVGGKSTDVNRQVRYNQSLLVSFFKHALAALAPGGTVVVTLFESEPYTLWNVKDLARHAGLQVDRSFRFQPAAYPGYHHARTLGVVKARSGEEGGGWKGEDRPSRSYVFVRKGDTPLPVTVGKNALAMMQGKEKKKRRRDEDSEDEYESEIN